MYQDYINKMAIELFTYHWLHKTSNSSSIAKNGSNLRVRRNNPFAGNLPYLKEFASIMHSLQRLQGYSTVVHIPRVIFLMKIRALDT